MTQTTRSVGPGVPERLRVMETVRELRPTTNPYIVQLVEALRDDPEVDLQLFSFSRAIFGKYDALHVHWPEALLGASSVLKRWRRRILVFAMLLRLRFSRTALVRTWHNLERPTGLARVDSLLLDLADRVTTLRIALNPTSTFPDAKPHVVIPHGHYRDWYTHPREQAVPGQVAYVGLIRRYKGVENLVTAFTQLPGPHLSLRVSGKPSTDELRTELTSLANDDPRISFDFRFLDDAEFVAAMTAGSLVVLPYHHMHNSGVALAALSLDRPVLVPDNEVNRMLADEVGPGWIHFFSGSLEVADLAKAVDAVQDAPPVAPPDLAARTWDLAGQQHKAAFRQAVGLEKERH